MLPSKLLNKLLFDKIRSASGTLFNHHRSVSALYLTGDKARENYMTLQPYLDFEETFLQKEQLELNISKRKMSLNLIDILGKYEKYKSIANQLEKLENERDLIAIQLKKLEKSNNTSTTDLSNNLKNEGKQLREQWKVLKENSYPIEDDFVHTFLNLPNTLHKLCPYDGKEKLLYRSKVSLPLEGKAHLEHSDLIRFIDNNAYYFMEEAADFDVRCTYAFTNYISGQGKFLQISNPDFVRLVLLEAHATPLTQYHMVMEENLQNSINPAYLTGGGSFESFLGAMTKMCVFPSVLPLRLVAAGRSYHKVLNNNPTANLFTATQTNAVQTFIATESASKADEQMEEIINLCVNFYQALGLHFRVVYADASELTAAESLRAVIEIYSPSEKRYVSVGHVSHYTNYVSKRILFCIRQQKKYHFLHMVGGPVLYTSRLIAALLENNINLTECKLLGETISDTPKQSAIEEFKELFK